MNPTVSVLLALFAASMRVSPSLIVVVIGFSTKAWTPAASACEAMAKWVDAGVQMVTASRSSFFSISPKELYPGTWKFLENVSDLSLFMSQTAARH